MGILEKLGLDQKKKAGIPNIGEMKKKAQDEAVNKKKIFIRAAIFVGFLALLTYALPQTGFRQVANYTQGEPWRADDLTAPFTFALQKSEAELEEEKEEIRQSTPAIFHIDENAQINLQNNIESEYSDLQPVFDSYVQWQRAKQDPDVSASNDSLRFIEERESVDINISESSWNALLQNYATIYFQNIPPQQFIGNRIRTQLTNISEELHNQGLTDISKDSLASDEILIRDLSQRTERTVRLSNVHDPEEAYEHAHLHFSQHFDDLYVEIADSLFDHVIVPNWIFSASDTQARLEDELSNISTTTGAIAQGQVIIRRGDIVNEEKANMLQSLADARAETASALDRWLRFGGKLTVLIVASFFFLFYLFLYRKKIIENNAMFLLVFLVLSIIILASGLLHQFDDTSAYIVPVAIAPLILTIIFDSRVGLLAAVTLAIITAVYNDNNFEYLVATIIACSFGVFSVRDINKRTQFFLTTPLVVLSGYVLVVTGFTLTRLGGWENYLNEVMFISINAVFILFTYPLILLFEKTFDLTTDFTLLELADTNLPLLKKLMNEAPGTFHHSLQVANLAESAAAAISANALLCRVGALYHDIGKMNKPGYFIENQTGTNEHDKLKPRMSALVIKAHVSDGVKMAEEHDLPDTIINCIKTHHGTSLIKFFYDKALKNSPDESEIREEDFRYDGPIPHTKETGILLLADGVEAASRAMKSPTYTKLENLITRMFDEHVHEGQLNHCPLTFHQLDIIKKSFLNILVGVYHSRVEYPEDEKEKSKTERENQPADTENNQTNTDKNNKDNSQTSKEVEHPNRPE